jgi:hypothetical protein
VSVGTPKSAARPLKEQAPISASAIGDKKRCQDRMKLASAASLSAGGGEMGKPRNGAIAAGRGVLGGWRPKGCAIGSRHFRTAFLVTLRPGKRAQVAVRAARVKVGLGSQPLQDRGLLIHRGKWPPGAVRLRYQAWYQSYLVPPVFRPHSWTRLMNSLEGCSVTAHKKGNRL